MFRKKILMSLSALVIAASVFVATEDVSASSYKVAPGDTLWRIGQAHGTTAQKIASLNGISTTDILHIGYELKVTGNHAEPTAEIKPETNPKPEVSTNSTTYVVKSGDTLSKIARAHGTTPAKIASLSGINTSDILHIGKKLQVDGQASNSSSNNITNTSSKPKTEPKPESKPKPEPVSNSGGYNASQLMTSANSVVGTPYVWGGTTQSGGFDCSGFIHWAYNDAGKQMSRTSTEGYYSRSYEISKSELQVGDLVFFKGTYRAGISHMGIYAGNNQFIHASTSAGVSVTSLDSSYWSKYFDSYKRFY